MINIKLTESECETLDTLLSVTNLCEANCCMDYMRIGCEDVDKDGNPRCELLKNIENIRNKLVRIGGADE